MLSARPSLIGCDVAGVNLMQDLITGEWFMLDTNTAPPIGTGPFMKDRSVAYAAYLKKRLSGKVRTERSVPASP